jgi:hypothetical protein
MYWQGLELDNSPIRTNCSSGLKSRLAVVTNSVVISRNRPAAKVCSSRQMLVQQHRPTLNHYFSVPSKLII